MLRNIWAELTLFDSGSDREQDEKDICAFLEALVFRNQGILRRRPSTPRLYRSGVVWEAPQQLQGDIEEVKILRQALGAAARHGDVRRVLEKIQDVLGGEHFCDIGVILERGSIDCDGLCCFRVAELRQKGIAARPFMTSRERPDGTTYHALVIWPPLGPCNYETSEDPSLLLGMYQPQKAAERLLEIQKNQERYDILRRYGRRALRPTTASNLTAPFDGTSLDAAVSDLLGTRRRVA